jgi:hypothetical protein
MEPTPTFEMQFHKGAASGQENGQSDQERNFDVIRFCHQDTKAPRQK